jgi:hypothetical protein
MAVDIFIVIGEIKGNSIAEVVLVFSHFSPASGA